ncbi:MAG TPA: HAMP domain-containing sensor histidine kinase [Acetobacteraceae bacterium]|jgi:signal transduction histidine kinase|nr:HAMP domain-containing sensor histidine kinase [Acetobacteraceae bacterium]
MMPDQERGGRLPRTVLPPALRLPAAAGLIVFTVAVGTTQVALQVTNQQADRQLQQLGQVYLDGLAASVRPGLEAADPDYIAGRFARAFTEQYGVAERALFAYSPDGRLLARHGDPALAAPGGDLMAEGGWRMDAAAGTAWTSRRVQGSVGPAGHLVAALDIRPVLAARERLAWTIVLVDLLLSAVFALLTWLVLRRLGRPLHVLVQELSDSAHRPPARLPEALVGAADPRMAHVLRAYNRMADGVRERERLRAELADREQAAALGQLAATVAHEVRNPLAGLAAAVSTLRHFGDRAEVREESLGLLERGIAALERIVTGTLDLYRPEEDRPLTRADFEDLRQLVRPAAERHGVTVAFELDLPEGDIGPGSGGVRQVLLNLLLNACAATPRSGAVGLQARVEDGELVCEITDEGAGLDPAQAMRLSGGTAPRTRRLGLGVVVSLLGNLDARASVTERPAGGTAIRLAIPLRDGAHA